MFFFGRDLCVWLPYRLAATSVHAIYPPPPALRHPSPSPLYVALHDTLYDVYSIPLHLYPSPVRVVGTLRKKAKEVTGGLFGPLAKCIKNLNPKEDPTLIMDVVAELKKVDGERRNAAINC